MNGKPEDEGLEDEEIVAPRLTRGALRELEESKKRPQRARHKPCVAYDVKTLASTGKRKGSERKTDAQQAKRPVYRKFKIIVVGGGFAGVSCARMLTDQGYDVVILEGRERLGGRVHSVVEDGATIELGAAVLMGVQGGNPLAKECRKYGLKMRKLDNTCPLHDVDGSLLPQAERFLI